MSDSHSEPNVPMHRAHPPQNIAEDWMERLIFCSRWIQAPLYVGLIIAMVIYAVRFGAELIHMCRGVTDMSEEDVMLGLLKLVDITMVANLVVMTVIGGYATFVSKLDLAAHPDRPDWLEKVDAATLKIKLSASLVGISGIHLLRSFIEIKEMETKHVMWQVIIHVVFLMSALILSVSERVLHGGASKH